MLRFLPLKLVSVVFLLISSPVPYADDLEIFPDQQWLEVSPADVQVAQRKIDRLFNLSFDDSATQGVVLIKNGKLVGERYADGFNKNSYGTSWSMAKSFYAALIGISIDRGEIKHLDEPVANYLEYFNDERKDITIRDLLNMTSGLEFPEHEHENMFFSADHLNYARSVGVEKEAGLTFEYNNVNSMLLADILLQATGIAADTLLRQRIFNKIGIDDATIWQDSVGTPLTYCCIDTTARQYSRFGLLFARSGSWRGEQIISKNFVDTTFSKVWDSENSENIAHNRGYSMHWWISRHDDRAVIFNASGKFGQYIFIDRANDVVFTRITKYYPTKGSKQEWGNLKYINWLGSINFRIALAGFLDALGLIDIKGDLSTPATFESGTSKQFYDNYTAIVDAFIDIGQPIK
ncbi:beta-lactamase family protein [SAR92 clade bacterium H921]|nr:beta-lactamase family protein [SAR92 clade bacterium H921]